MIVELAGDDFVGDLNDQIAFFLVQKFSSTLAMAAAFLRMPKALMSSLGIVSRPAPAENI